MFGSIWQIVRGSYTRRRSGIDKGNIEHLRADLRFRLAMVEYAYFGRSGKRVTRCLAELRAILGDKAMHRYLRTLDPDLRTQFVERFQGARRDTGSATDFMAPERPAAGPASGTARILPDFARAAAASNVVPINHAARKPDATRTGDPAEAVPRANPDPRSLDSGD